MTLPRLRYGDRPYLLAAPGGLLLNGVSCVTMLLTLSGLTLTVLLLRVEGGVDRLLNKGKT